MKKNPLRTAYSAISFKSFNKNKSPTNEDRYSIKKFPHFVLFAIFDGHSGPAISNYSSLHFLNYLGKNLIKHGTDMNIFKTTFLGFDKILAQEFGRKQDGSTVTVLYIDKHKIISANAGDSLAYLIKKPNPFKTIIKKITTDHDFHNERERKRVTSAGGKFHQGYYTVGNHMLQPTRGFGDFMFKNAKGHNGQDIHTALPTVREYPIKSDDKFLVLATDGILVGSENEPQHTITMALSPIRTPGVNSRIGHKFLLHSILHSHGIFGKPLYYPDDVTILVIDIPLIRNLI